MQADPPVHDFVDAATALLSFNRTLSAHYATCNTNCHNTPPTMPQRKKKADYGEDILAIDKKIKELKQDKWETETKHHTNEIIDLKDRIKNYKQLQK